MPIIDELLRNILINLAEMQESVYCHKCLNCYSNVRRLVHPDTGDNKQASPTRGTNQPSPTRRTRDQSHTKDNRPARHGEQTRNQPDTGYNNPARHGGQQTSPTRHGGRETSPTRRITHQPDTGDNKLISRLVKFITAAMNT